MCMAGHFKMAFCWLFVVFVTKSTMGAAGHFIESAYRVSNFKDCTDTDPAGDFASLLSSAANCLRRIGCSQFSYCKRSVVSKSISTSQEADCTCYLKRLICQNGGTPNSEGTCDCLMTFYGKECENRIRDCSDPQIKKDPSSTNRYGTAYIFPDTASEPFLVYCDLHYGFTFLQARVSQSCTRTSFQRSWQDYRDGFGDFTCDFWLGLDKIHQITSQAQYKLEILIDDGTGYKQCFYDPFRVEGASSNFTAFLVQFDEDPDCNSFLGNDAGFGINNIPFSTTDHDSTVNRCPSVLTSGWWFDNVCSVGNPNGPYISQNTFLNNNSPPRLRIGGTYAGKWVKEFLMRIENVGG